MPYYYVRVLDNKGEVLALRCEKASGPREACKLAFGAIYDRDTDTCRYKMIGNRKPAYLPEYKKTELRGPHDWFPIPKTGN